MNKTIYIDDKPVRIEWTKSAYRRLMETSTSLIVDMELLFSCFVAKRVHFTENATNYAHDSAMPEILVQFRSTVSSTCDLSGTGGPISHVETPLAGSVRFVPDWCRVDYVNGIWHGEFGYDRGHASRVA
jgi:hypothetical protein